MYTQPLKSAIGILALAFTMGACEACKPVQSTQQQPPEQGDPRQENSEQVDLAQEKLKQEIKALEQQKIEEFDALIQEIRKQYPGIDQERINILEGLRDQDYKKITDNSSRDQLSVLKAVVHQDIFEGSKLIIASITWLGCEKEQLKLRDLEKYTEFLEKKEKSKKLYAEEKPYLAVLRAWAPLSKILAQEQQKKQELKQLQTRAACKPTQPTQQQPKEQENSPQEDPAQERLKQEIKALEQQKMQAFDMLIKEIRKQYPGIDQERINILEGLRDQDYKKITDNSSLDDLSVLKAVVHQDIFEGSRLIIASIPWFGCEKEQLKLRDLEKYTEFLEKKEKSKKLYAEEKPYLAILRVWAPLSKILAQEQQKRQELKQLQKK